MVIIDLFSEAHHLSVNDTRRPTLFADVADACRTISKNTLALDVDTLLPDSENVRISTLRQLVTQGSRQKRHRLRQNEIPQDYPPYLQKPNQGKKLTAVISVYLNHPQSSQ